MTLFLRNLGVAMRNWCLAVGLLVSCCALPQTTSPVIRGSWLATLGPARVLHGIWSGHALLGRPDAAQGSWTLVSDANLILLKGTWSTQKSPRGWQGTWSARTLQGRSFSGTWESNLAGFNGKTFEDMLRHTSEKVIAGEWRSGRLRGNWRLTR